MNSLKFCARNSAIWNSKPELKKFCAEFFTRVVVKGMSQGKFRSIPGIIFHAWAILAQSGSYLSKKARPSMGEWPDL